MNKKLISIILALSMLLPFAFVMPASAYTGTKYGDYLYYRSNGTSVTISDCDESATGAIEIPSTIGGKPVTSIDYNAFYGCSRLTSVTIPDSVTSIGGYAFYNCSGLTSVVIPDGVTSIGKSAFWYCTGLTTINMGTNVESMERTLLNIQHFIIIKQIGTTESCT